jgi:solute carrier family 25 citrate transporter 1
MPPAQEKQATKQSSAKAILAGGISGGIEICITYPTEFIKTHLQLHEKKGLGIMGAVMETVKKKGVLGLYRGLSPSFYFSVPKSAVRFYAFETFKKQLQDEKGKMTPGMNFLAGLGAGVAEAILVVTPQETIKVKMVHDILSPNPQYRGFVHGVSTIVKEQGIKGTYKGLFPTILKQGSNQAIRFVTYEAMMDWFAAGRDKKTINPGYSVIAGALAGAASVFGNTPIDVIKTRMQGLQAAKYRGSLHCAQEIWKEAGIAGFYKGTVPRLGRVCLDVAIVMTLYREINKLLDKIW